MKYITLKINGGGQLLIDKTLIKYAIDNGKFTTLVLTDDSTFDVVEGVGIIDKLLQ